MACASDTVHHPSIMDMISKLSNTAESILFLRSEGILISTLECEKCLQRMTLMDKPIAKLQDGQVFRCTKCKKEKSIRTHSIFFVSIRAFSDTTFVFFTYIYPYLILFSCIFIAMSISLNFA